MRTSSVMGHRGKRARSSRRAGGPPWRLRRARRPERHSPTPPPSPATAGVNATRLPSFLLARHERALLEAIARRLPRFVCPDHLTLLGVLAAGGICAAYALSNGDPAWLWVASALLVVHWLGDSLDGCLARVRRIERPRYGYYLDHLVDALSTVLIGVGLGLSPFMALSVGVALVAGYLVLSINVYLESQALGRFSIGYGRLGPTEMRLILIAINAALALTGGLALDLWGLGLSALDLGGIAIAALMACLLAGRAAANLRELALAEPAGLERGRS